MFASVANVSASPASGAYEVTCPHCKRTFEAELLGGAAARHTGFKCPHCRLFVPLARVEDDLQRAS